jgi:hypothetical protein
MVVAVIDHRARTRLISLMFISMPVAASTWPVKTTRHVVPAAAVGARDSSPKAR